MIMMTNQEFLESLDPSDVRRRRAKARKKYKIVSVDAESVKVVPGMEPIDGNTVPRPRGPGAKADPLPEPLTVTPMGRRNAYGVYIPFWMPFNEYDDDEDD